MEKNKRFEPNRERGMALITSLLATTMLLALGLAVVLSTTNDTTTTKTQRVGEQAFFAADAGIGIARRALAQALNEEIDKIRNGETAFYHNGTFPDIQVLPPPGNNDFYNRVRDRARQLSNTVTARNQKLDQLNGSSFDVTVGPLSGTVTLGTPSETRVVEVIVLRYSIQVTGKTSNGGTSSVNETGRLSANITLTGAASPSNRAFKFSGFGAFFDQGDTTSTSALAAGTFSGPVHTNTHFSFVSSRNVAFRNVVSQVDNQIRYDRTSSGSTTPNRDRPPPSLTGIDISSEGYKQTSPVPLPTNNFSQEYAVINSTGVTDLRAGMPVDPPAVIPTDSQGNPVAVFDSAGRVETKVLAANLRNASNQAPNGSGSSLPTGVYISSADGATISGSGIYVQGNASDIQLYADTNGDQVYVIQQTQGSTTTTTTIRTNYTSSTTTISSGSNSHTYSGLFMDKADPLNVKPGASLFVNGSINGLRGGKNGSTNRPAIASQTALTVTAQRDITITGDLKYADPVANSDGTPVSNINAIKNVLGVFTNDGNANLAPNTSYVSGPGRSLAIDAAVVTFNSNTSNDGSGEIEGSITYTGTAAGSNDRWKLVGSRVQSKINNIGYSYRDIFFDVRFSGGKFAPPFFPGTTYDLGPEPTVSATVISAVDAPFATAMSWFRDSN